MERWAGVLIEWVNRKEKEKGEYVWVCVLASDVLHEQYHTYPGIYFLGLNFSHLTV